MKCAEDNMASCEGLEHWLSLAREVLVGLECHRYTGWPQGLQKIGIGEDSNYHNPFPRKAVKNKEI
jgi:hypothetical protein